MFGVDPDWGKMDGLLPCITQDALTGRVLMLAYVDEEALDATLETGEMHYHSRSRNELWRKGETSGHIQEVESLHLDCDGDALLARVHQTGPACHTGEPACFFNAIESGTISAGPESPTLEALDTVLSERMDDAPEGSWTHRLYEDEDLRLSKVEEEARELVDAARGDGEDPLVHEAADLLYHLLVVARAGDVTLRDILRELEARRD